MKYKVKDEYMNRVVCLPGEVVTTSGKTSQRILRRLYTLGLPHVEVVQEEKPKSEETKEEE